MYLSVYEADQSINNKLAYLLHTFRIAVDCRLVYCYILVLCWNIISRGVEMHLGYDRNNMFCWVKYISIGNSLFHGI